MKNIVTLLALAGVLAACDKSAAENTKVNERDREASTTPMDQGNGKADLDVTANIRKALMADDGLSTTAKNVKIVTSNGTVTLRGPVKNDAEKKAVEAKAVAAAAGQRVDNQLDIETK